MVKADNLSQRFGHDFGYRHHDRLCFGLLPRYPLRHQTVVVIDFFFVGVVSGFYTVFKEVFKEIKREERESSDESD